MHVYYGYMCKLWGMERRKLREYVRVKGIRTQVQVYYKYMCKHWV